MSEGFCTLPKEVRFKESRGADRRQLLGQDGSEALVGPWSSTTADTNVMPEIVGADLMPCQVDLNRACGMKRLEAGEARHEPADTEGRRSPDGETLGLVPRSFNPVANQCKRVPERLGQDLAPGRKDEVAMKASEKGSAKFLLKNSNLPADGTLSHVKLIGRRDHAAQPGRRLEGSQGIQGRESARYGVV
jgi:hypothetical protein